METATKDKMERTPIKQYGDSFTGYIRMPHQKKPRQAWGKSEAEVNKKLDEYIEYENNRKASQKARQVEKNEKEKAARVEAAKVVKPGDVFEYSWGYDQTNVEFWEVTEVRGKMATLREVGQNVVEGSEGFMCETVTPNKGVYRMGHEMKKLIKGDATHPYFSMDHGVLTKWDGKPQHQSHYA